MNHTFGYDNVGNITERDSSISGFPWRECFDYNDLNKLTGAYTVDAADTCTGGDAGEGAFGYESSYSYSADGNLTSRTEDGTTTDYTYPAAGASSTRPHAPTTAGEDTYEWDDSGNLVERTVDGDTETFAWSAERFLDSVTGPEGTTSFTYGVDGQRLLRTSPDGTRTLYLDGHEVRADPAGTTVTATRTYSYGGQLIATRTAAGVDYLLSDQQGSIEAAVPSGTSSPAGARIYLPYGTTRAGGPAGIDTDRGWIGQVEDATTDLSYLNARYYDPTAGVFLSPDPLYDPTRPQSLNPYAYGHGNPTTQSDPTGLAAIVTNSSRPNVVWSANFKPFGTGKGAFAGSKSAMVKMNISPAAVSRRQYNTYKPAYDANKAMWAEMERNPGYRAQMIGIANLQAMHRACPTASCVGLYKALAEVGAERLIRIAEGIEAQRRAQRRIQQQKDDALASFVPAHDGGGDSGGCSIKPGMGNGGQNVVNAASSNQQGYRGATAQPDNSGSNMCAAASFLGLPIPPTWEGVGFTGLTGFLRGVAGAISNFVTGGATLVSGLCRTARPTSTDYQGTPSLPAENYNGAGIPMCDAGHCYP